MNIELLNRWGEDFLNFAWPMLWQSSVLIGVIFVIDLALRRKVRAAIRHALWLVVLMKLVLPPTLALPTSPSWWIHSPAPPPAKAPPVSFTVTYGDQVMPDFPAAPAPIIPPKPKPPVLKLAAWAMILSCIVNAGLLVWLLIRWRGVVRKVRNASETKELDGMVTESARLAGLRSAVRLKLTEDSMSPAVCGLFRPVILLPQSLVEKLSTGQLRAVLLHELIHLRRGDVWVNCAQALLQIFYWWHTLLWLANARIRRVREEAVDDAVMLALRDDADIYATTLLEVAKLAFNRPLASLGLVGILESRSALRQRIERLVNFNTPKKAGLTVVSILGILAFSAVALPMGEAPEKTNVPTALVSNSPNDTNAPKTVFMGRMGANTVMGTFLNLQSADDRTNANPQATNLEMRTFQVNPHSFPAWSLDFPTNNILANTINLESLSKRLGVDLTAPGRSVAYNGGLGLLMVKATPLELDTVKSVVEVLNRTAPQIHIKTRFLKVPAAGVEEISNAGTAVDTNTVEIIAADKITSLLHQLESASGVEILAEPEVVTTTGRQTLMRSDNSTLELVPRLLEDGYTLNLQTIVSKPETRIAQVNIWDGQTLALILPGSDRENRLAVLVTSWIVDPAGNRVHSDDELRLMQEKAMRDIPPQHTLILSDPNFRGMVHTLEQSNGVETLASKVSYTNMEMRVFKVNTNAFLAAVRDQTDMNSSEAAKSPDLLKFFSAIGVDLTAPGRSIAFNDRLGLLFLKATPSELDTIERVIQVLNQVTPQIHIKARFIEVEQDNNPARGFDWYLGSFTNGPVITNGHSAPSLAPPVSPANPFGNRATSGIPASATDQQLTSGLRNTVPAPATVTGILTDPNFRVTLHALESRPRTTILAEPECVTISGRQTQMRATVVQTVLTNINPLALKPPGVSSNELFLTEQVECGPVFVAVPYVLADEYTLNLTITASVTEFLRYDKPTNSVTVYINGKKQTVPVPLPKFRTQQISTVVNLWDGQTLVLGGPLTSTVQITKDKVPLLGDLPLVGGLFRSQTEKSVENHLMVFVTASIVDPAGNRLHSDDEMRQIQEIAKKSIPPQPH